MGAAVLRAHLRDHRRPRRQHREPRGGPVAAAVARPRGAARPRPRRSPTRSRPGCAPVRSCSTRCSSTSRSTTGCAATRRWIASRNLANEASDESVQALVDAVQARYDIPQRWYALKAQLLGRRQLADYDRMASVATADEEFGWTEARDLVLDAYASFSPELAVGRAALLRRVVDRRADAARQAPGRVLRLHGAVAAPVPAAQLDRRAAATCSRSRTRWATACTPTSRATRASSTRPRRSRWPRPRRCSARRSRSAGCSTRRPTREQRLALLAESLEGQIATVFRQVAMNRFEDRVHTQRRDEGELSVEQFNEVWATTQAAMLGDTVEITDGYRTWWSYIPHFIGTPGYVYAYSYGQLLALSVYRAYEQQGADFVPRYLELLASRGVDVARGARARSSASTSPTRRSGTAGSRSSTSSSRRPRSRGTRAAGRLVRRARRSRRGVGRLGPRYAFQATAVRHPAHEHRHDRHQVDLPEQRLERGERAPEPVGGGEVAVADRGDGDEAEVEEVGDVRARSSARRRRRRRSARSTAYTKANSMPIST